jgi:hypothetical protein
VQGRANVLRLIAHLGVGEAQRRVPGGEVVLVATAIASLLRRRTVVAQPIGLNQEPQVGPEEVDAEPIEVLARERNRQSRLGRKRQEKSLKFGIGKSKRAPVEELAQPANPLTAPISLEPSAESLRINQVKPIRLIHRSLDPCAIKARGDVDQGENHCGRRYVEEGCEISLSQVWTAVDAETRRAAVGVRWNRDLNRP